MTKSQDCLISQPQNYLMFERITKLAYKAMLKEVHLYPKPGLVDPISNGAHHDMDVSTFEKSAAAILPFLNKFLSIGFKQSHDLSNLLSNIRDTGILCEKAMFKATKGVNTHKGMIFFMGLICASIGFLSANKQKITVQNISETIKLSCSELVSSELANGTRVAKTAGEKLYKKHGLKGARGEAASGLITVIDHGIPIYRKSIAKGNCEIYSLLNSLMNLMEHNDDTNIVSRGSIEDLKFTKNYAGKLLEQNLNEKNLVEELIIFDDILIAKNLSPGGSADLLAITWFLSNFKDR